MGIIDKIRSINPKKLDLDNKKMIENLITTFLNIIEGLLQRDQKNKEEIQKLKDEINHLKGEKGKPEFKPNLPRKENDICKEKKAKEWKKRSKKQYVKVDTIEILKVDKGALPPDAIHKGYRCVVVQNVNFTTNNVKFKMERYYSPSEKKVYEAKLPKEVYGEFGPQLKAFIHTLYFACRVTENKIQTLLSERGIIISKGQISNILIKDKQEKFSKEKNDILTAGMECSNYFHIDDTGARHNGMNYYTHAICNQFFSAFFIRPRKNKETIKAILGLKNGEKINKIMLSDDARQFKLLALYHALCWLHEVRHFKKLNPFLEWHRKKLIWVLSEIWEFYESLKEYKENPNECQKKYLELKFDELFSAKTGYKELDKRIVLTKEKKNELLLVLTYPEIPLHNNPAELALRELVIKNKVSYGTKSEDGRIAWENMMTIMNSCKKNTISFMDYVEDISSGRYRMTRLCEVIRKNSMGDSTSY